MAVNDGEYDVEILRDLLKEGYSGQELFNHFVFIRDQLPKAFEAMINAKIEESKGVACTWEEFLKEIEEEKYKIQITIGSDHGAVELKNAVKKVLQDMNVTFEDVGTFDEEAVDYPDIAEKVCTAVIECKSELGIVMCGTGIGISIAANKIKGIRCALCNDVFSAKMSREHNNANVLALGGRVLGIGPASEIVRAWITTDFSEDERHKKRIEKISALEK